MRPIRRGESPQDEEFEPYRAAFGPLVRRIGPYCSYCERRIPTQLAVEHIQPKGLPQYEHLIGTWDNYVLGCVNCNGTKTDKDVVLSQFFLPDRDNTAAAFDYLEDGRVVPASGLDDDQTAVAQATLELCGLEKPVSQIVDENGLIVAVDRVSQRMETWLLARTSRDDLEASRTEGMLRQVLKTAQMSGYFSIWMKVFEGDIAMRQLLLNGLEQDGERFGFPGTELECFDDQTNLVSPRPANGLPDGGKI